MGARFLSGAGLGSGNIIGRAQFPPSTRTGLKSVSQKPQPKLILHYFEGVVSKTSSHGFRGSRGFQCFCKLPLFQTTTPFQHSYLVAHLRRESPPRVLYVETKHGTKTTPKILTSCLFPVSPSVTFVVSFLAVFVGSRTRSRSLSLSLSVTCSPLFTAKFGPPFYTLENSQNLFCFCRFPGKKNKPPSLPRRIQRESISKLGGDRSWWFGVLIQHCDPDSLVQNPNGAKFGKVLAGVLAKVPAKGGVLAGVLQGNQEYS